MSNFGFLTVAESIGKKICESAKWSKNCCSWNISKPTNKRDRKILKSLADGSVYQGTSGIALFLMELYKYINKDCFISSAKGAINYALNEANQYPNNSFGFHSGRIGIAYSTIKLAEILNSDTYKKKAHEIVTPLVGNERNDERIDVIGGAAGAIPALLYMNQVTLEKEYTVMAINLAENLIEKTSMELTGWSWKSSDYSYRNWLGFAHGTSGMANAFLELYKFTASSYFLYAAEQALLYERQFYNTDLNNWPDFRYRTLSDFIYYGEIEALVETLKSNKLEPYNTKYMSAWCHGAPGIGLTRNTAYNITKNKVYLKELNNAIKGTIRALESEKGQNYSLCHGISGNCDLLIEATKTLGNPKYLKIAAKYGEIGIEKYFKKDLEWPCGTRDNVSDPSLMLGEAGIGYFYLRLFDSNIPSILSISLSKGKKYNFKKNYKYLQKKYINHYFSNSIKSINTILNKNISIKFKLGDSVSDVTKIFNKINKITSQSKNCLLMDSTKIEFAKYYNSINLSKFYLDFIDNYIKRDITYDGIKNSIITLNEKTQVFSTDYNWDKIKNNNIIDLQKDKRFHIVFRKENVVASIPISLFSYAILSSINNGLTFEELVERLKGLLDPKISQDISKFHKKIAQQLLIFYNQKFISFKFKGTYEDYILNIVKESVNNNVIDSIYDIANNNILQILRTYSKHLSKDDKYYRIFQIEKYFYQLVKSLKILNLTHYYLPTIDKYKKEDSDKREMIFNEFISILKRTFFNNSFHYIINQ